MGTEEDYFSNEQVQVWGIDGFWGLPHYPKIKYYRGLTKERTNSSKLFEFIVPTFPVNWLDEETVEKYKTLLSEGGRPTALSLSVIDIKEPADFGAVVNPPEHPEHWCLSHYVVDGHHKVYVAALLNQPITILFFLAQEESIAEGTQIKDLFNSF